MNSQAKRLGVYLAIGIIVVAGGAIGFEVQTIKIKQGASEAVKTSKLLGVSLNRLISEFGKPSSTIQALKEGAGMYMFDKGQLVVTFVESKSYQVNYSLGSNTKDMASAKLWAQQMIPSDAKLIQTRKGINQQPVDSYKSVGLAGLFGQEMFSDSSGSLHPGYFDVSYVSGKTSKVTEVDFTVGDNS